MLTEKTVNLIKRAVKAGNTSPTIAQLKTLATAIGDTESYKALNTATIHDIIDIKKKCALFGKDKPDKVSEGKGNLFGLEGKDTTIASEKQTKIYDVKPMEKPDSDMKNIAERKKVEEFHPETSDRKVETKTVSEPLKEKVQFPEVLNRGEKQQKEIAKETTASVKTADYQGWKNYESWAVALHFDNDRELSEMVGQMAREAVENAPNASQVADKIWDVSEAAKFSLAEQLQSYIEEQNPLADQASLYGDLMTSAISEVDFDEVAEGILERIGEEKTGSKTAAENPFAKPKDEKPKEDKPESKEDKPESSEKKEPKEKEPKEPSKEKSEKAKEPEKEPDLKDIMDLLLKLTKVVEALAKQDKPEKPLKPTPEVHVDKAPVEKLPVEKPDAKPAPEIHKDKAEPLPVINPKEPIKKLIQSLQKVLSDFTQGDVVELADTGAQVTVDSMGKGPDGKTVLVGKDSSGNVISIPEGTQVKQNTEVKPII